MKTLHTIALLMSLLIILLPVVHATELNLIYDENGNLITGDGKYRVYNSLNQLSKIYNGSDAEGDLLEELTYHPVEERILVKKVYNTSGLKETVYYIDENFVRVVNSSGSYDYKYVKHNGQLIAQEVDGVKTFIHPDHLGSSTIVTDINGTVIENSTYEPFGSIVEGGENTRYDYTGQEHDSVVGDYDYNARRYKSEWGLFTQPDTLISNFYNPQDLNRYSYAYNNPYKYYDSTGRYEEDVHFDLTLFLAVAAGYSSDEANKIADANRQTDKGLTHPWFLATKDYIIGSKDLKKYHFQTREEAEKRLKEALEKGDPEEIGQALHTYQDSYSHEGLTAASHAELGSAPDKTYNDVAKANEMAFNTFFYLAMSNNMEFSEIVNRWNEISHTVNSFNSARSRSSKIRILGRSGGSIRYSGSNEIVRHSWGRFGRGGSNAYCSKNCG